MFACRGLEFDQMTFVFEFDVDMINIQVHAKNEVSMLKYSKIIARTHTHPSENITFPAIAFHKKGQM